MQTSWFVFKVVFWNWKTKNIILCNMTAGALFFLVCGITSGIWQVRRKTFGSVFFMSEHKGMPCTSEHGFGLNKQKNSLPLLKGNCIIWCFYLLLVTDVLLERIQSNCFLHRKRHFLFSKVYTGISVMSWYLHQIFVNVTVAVSASLLLACLIAKSHFVWRLYL